MYQDYLHTKHPLDLPDVEFDREPLPDEVPYDYVTDCVCKQLASRGWKEPLGTGSRRVRRHQMLDEGAGEDKPTTALVRRQYEDGAITREAWEPT